MQVLLLFFGQKIDFLLIFVLNFNGFFVFLAKGHFFKMFFSFFDMFRIHWIDSHQKPSGLFFSTSPILHIFIEKLGKCSKTIIFLIFGDFFNSSMVWGG